MVPKKTANREIKLAVRQVTAESAIDAFLAVWAAESGYLYGHAPIPKDSSPDPDCHEVLKDGSGHLWTSMSPAIWEIRPKIV